MMINAYAFDQFDAPGLFVPNPLTPSAMASGANAVTWGASDTEGSYQPTGRLNQQTTGDMLDVCASFRNVSFGAGTTLMLGFTTNPAAAVAGWYPGADADSWGVRIGILTTGMQLYRQGAYVSGFTLTGAYVDAEISVRTVADLYTAGRMGLSVRIVDPSYGGVEAFSADTIIQKSAVIDSGLRVFGAVVGSGLNSRSYRMLSSAEASFKPAGSFYLG